VDPSIQYWLDAADRLKASSLKYTRVIPGFFMDYWGMPHAKTNLFPYVFGIDIANGVAAIPGDGNDVICMTYTYDLANYMVKLLELDEWPEFSVFVGDEVTYNEILAIAEDIRGRLGRNLFQ
jgi:nucleoside-diphosphate-sugar epimerase